MREIHPACLPAQMLLAHCDVRHERRRGPGGQHRNKVSTAVVLTFRPTGLRAEASERRSQVENQQQALRRLRLRLAVEFRLPPESQPTPLWQSRVRGGRLAVNPSHDDFPALLAEALDQLADVDYDLPAAAERLGITSSQLARFLQREPAAWSRLNDCRRQCGLRPLH